VLETAFESLADGRRLRVARAGDGPPLVLLHGYPDNLQIWCDIAPRLAGVFKVIAFDWPGMGYSDPWLGGASPFQMADRLLALLDQWKIERAHIAGFDMGGQPALVFASRHPDRVSSLIVMNSLVLWNEKTSWEIAVLRKFGWNRIIIRRLPRAVFIRAERTFLPRGVKLPSDLRADLWRGFSQVEVRRFIVRMCAGYQATLPRLPELYARIQTPTLVMWGEHDRHFPPAHAEKLHQAIAGSELRIIPGGEHWMQWYLAEPLAQEIISFSGKHQLRVPDSALPDDLSQRPEGDSGFAHQRRSQ
jgi:2-hydroxy-6-oxonona-2,4-dienedioate hydrolase